MVPVEAVYMLCHHSNIYIVQRFQSHLMLIVSADKTEIFERKRRMF